jgi:plastocyanin
MMTTKRTLPILAAAAIAVTGAIGATASASSGAAGQSSVVIRHQLHGCHSWSVNGDGYNPKQALTLHRGGSFTITNNDVMSHKLIETSGPAVKITRVSAGMGMGDKGTFAAPMMARMGAESKVTFAKAGVYTFTTKPGEDFMAGVKTVGEDNVLKLTVTVR